MNSQKSVVYLFISLILLSLLLALFLPTPLAVKGDTWETAGMSESSDADAREISTVDVSITNSGLDPERVIIYEGDIIRWKNETEQPVTLFNGWGNKIFLPMIQIDTGGRSLTVPDETQREIRLLDPEIGTVPPGGYIEVDFEKWGHYPYHAGLEHPLNGLIIVAIPRKDMVYVPNGTFQMGCDESKGESEYCNSDELPLHGVYLDSFYIDKTEVTNGAYKKCVDAGACALPVYTTFSGNPYFGDPYYNDYPVVFMTWGRAAAYCDWAGKRLPTEAEWVKAARGDDDTRIYPWGDQDPDCSLLNYQDPTGYCVGDSTIYVNKVGSYPFGASPYGVLDMAGNVSEWVNDWFDQDYYAESPFENPLGPSEGSSKVIHGGSYIRGWTGVRISDRGSRSPDDHHYEELGFRCAADGLD